MDARAYWQTYVDRCGGVMETAEHLKTPYSSIAAICNGSRGIGRELAQRFSAADPLLDENVLIWVRPTKQREGIASDRNGSGATGAK